MIKVLSDTEGGLIFEAEIFSDGKNPSISFWEDETGKVCLNFHNFDSAEMIDGYTSEQVDEVMNTIMVARKHSIQLMNDKIQRKLFPEKKKRVKEELMINSPKPNRNNDTYIIKLIEISTECVDVYEKYLLDQAGHNDLAKKMKQLRTHVSKFMGMSKLDQDDGAD